MATPDNSMKKYNQSSLVQAGTSSNNWSRPNINSNNGGRLQSTNVSNIFNGMPKVNWNSYSSTDPTLNFGSTSSSISGSGFVDGLNKAMLIGTSIFAVANMGLGIANAIKGSKGSSKDVATDTNLASLVNTAEDYGSKDDLASMQNTAQNLTTAINTSQTKLDNAKRGVQEAETKLTKLDTEKNKYDSELETFDTQKDELTTNIDKSKGQLAELKAIPEDKRTPAQKQKITELEAQINDMNEKLRNDFSDTKRKNITTQINRVAKEIQEWKNKQVQYKNDIKQLPSEIKSAQNALEKLNKKIMKHVS